MSTNGSNRKRKLSESDALTPWIWEQNKTPITSTDRNEDEKEKMKEDPKKGKKQSLFVLKVKCCISRINHRNGMKKHN